MKIRSNVKAGFEGAEKALLVVGTPHPPTF